MNGVVFQTSTPTTVHNAYFGSAVHAIFCAINPQSTNN